MMMEEMTCLEKFWNVVTTGTFTQTKYSNEDERRENVNDGDFNLAAAYDDEVLRNNTMAACSGPGPVAAMAKVMFFETHSKESRDVTKAATRDFQLSFQTRFSN